MPEFPCISCNKNVNKNHKAVQCDICDGWIHLKCNYFNNNDYKYLQNSNEPFFCIKCIEANIPFSKLSNKEFCISIVNGVDIFNEELNIDFLLPSQNKTINQLNAFMQEKFQMMSSDTDHEYDETPPINCNYFDIDEFQKAKFDSSKSFSIFHLNIHSIQKHIEELKTLLQLMNHKFDILAISESKIQKGRKPILDITIEGYQTPLGIPTESTKGGVLLYVSNELNFKPRNDLNIYQSKGLESLFIEVINKNKVNDIIGVIYRHPSMCPDDFNENHLRQLMHKLSQENAKNIYIAGDFNFNLINSINNQETSDFFDLLMSNFLLPTILLPTKINNGPDTLIDNIFSNRYSPDIISGNLTISISDHLPSFCIFPKHNQNHLPKKHNIYKRDRTNFKDNADFMLFREDFLKIDWLDKLEIEKQDVNHSFNAFYEQIEKLMDKYLPLKKISKKDFKRKYKPWITHGILASMKRRDKLFGKYIRTKSPDYKSSLYIEYKTLRNKIIFLIKESKHNFYTHFFNKNKSNIRNLWKGINQIVNLKSKSYDNPTCVLDENGDSLTDPTDISNNFNTYFSSVAETILDERKYAGDGNFRKYMPKPLPNSIAVDPVDGNEISLIISKFKTNKATGPTSVPTDILHYLKYDIARPLCWIINISLSSGIHPDKLKIAKVIPIYKKGSKLQACNYRPISLLSNLNKIFEKIVFSRVYSFLDKYGSLYSLQFGFRQNHSTEHALINIIDKIQETLDTNLNSPNKTYACGVFVDFQKAFDTVNHKILLEKLEHYGIRGPLKEWLRSYLTNRKQFVSILGFNSNISTINHGVPQGSVLGPLLFLIYINDLHLSIKSSTVYHFADDTSLLQIDKSYKKIQQNLNHDLKGLCKWLLANKISLNTSKTEIIFFKKSSETLPENIKIKINGQKLYRTTELKYLGVYLDETLEGSAHCRELLPKLRQAIGILAKTKDYLTKDQRLSLYHATFSSSLLYGCQVWATRNDSFLNKLQSLQNTAIRIISNTPKYDHISPIYQDLRVLKFKDNITLKNCLLIHDQLNDKLPKSFNAFYKECENIYTINTRGASRGQLFVPSFDSTKYGRKSLKVHSILSWNYLSNLYPNSKFKDMSKNQLKKLLKNHFLDMYVA